MITNGFLLTKEKIEKLNQSKLYSLQISIDGIKPTKITIKVLKFLKSKLILLKKYAKFKININIVIGSTNSSEAIKVVKFCNNLKLASTLMLIHDHNGQSIINEKSKKNYLLADKLRIKPFWEINNFGKNMLNNSNASFKCRAGSRYLYIDEFGKVNWCSQKRKNFNKDLMKYSLKDLKKQFYTYKNCSENCTLRCVRLSSFFDNWRYQKNKKKISHMH